MSRVFSILAGCLVIANLPVSQVSELGAHILGGLAILCIFASLYCSLLEHSRKYLRKPVPAPREHEECPPTWSRVRLPMQAPENDVVAS